MIPYLTLILCALLAINSAIAMAILVGALTVVNATPLGWILLFNAGYFAVDLISMLVKLERR